MILLQVVIKCYLTGYTSTHLQCLQEEEEKAPSVETVPVLEQTACSTAQSYLLQFSLTDCSSASLFAVFPPPPLRSPHCELPASRDHGGCFLQREVNPHERRVHTHFFWFCLELLYYTVFNCYTQVFLTDELHRSPFAPQRMIPFP